ncbi:hypothetical protein Tco_0734605 [Tanacetum coccineum]
MMFQQHHGELSEDMDRLKRTTLKSPSSWHRPLAPSPNFYDHVNPVTRQTIDQSAGGKLCDLSVKESWALLEDLALYDTEVVERTIRVFAKGRIKSHRFASRCLDGPHNTQYCMEDLKQAFVEYASSRTNEAREQVRKLNLMLESLGLVPQSFIVKFVCSKEDDGEVMFIEIIRDDDEPWNEGPNEGEGSTMEEPVVEYFDTFPTRYELTYHRYLMSGLVPSIFLRNPIIMEGCPYNIKIPCNIRHMHIEKAYIDLNSPLNIMARMMYNWIMRIKLDLRENANRGISNFTRTIKGIHVFVGNFTYVVDFMIVKDISSIIDPRLSQVVLGRPFIEISNMTHDPPEGVVRFIRGADEVAYKIPHKIEQYDPLSDLEKEHSKSIYLRNEEDKRRGVEYVMIKILGFYKEFLELGPEYITGMDDEGEVEKPNLLENKQILSVGVFDEVLENQLLSISLLICLGKGDCVRIPSGTSCVNKSSSPTDSSTQQDTPPSATAQSTTELITLTITITAEDNM